MPIPGCTSFPACVCVLIPGHGVSVGACMQLGRSVQHSTCRTSQSKRHPPALLLCGWLWATATTGGAALAILHATPP
eukprot:scaffold200112_cov18-Tisochrysis_lutea.AAC.2